MSEDIMTDVYNGDIWKDFNGRKYQFFNEERNYAVMLNIDWFQPFKYTNYSVGAIYMTILNLPRHLRFKKKKCHSCWAYPRYEDRASYKYIY